MVIGSSALPAILISCISALPMEVTRRETCMGLPSKVPSQEPAKVFNSSKDFCASDCAKATVERLIRTTGSRKRRDFIFILLSSEILWVMYVHVIYCYT